MSDVVIFGATDFADCALYFLNAFSDHHVVGFTTESDYKPGTTHAGLPVFPFESIEQELPPNDVKMFVAVGPSHYNTLRKRIFETAILKGYRFISFVSPKAVVAENVRLGENVFIFDNVTIEPFVEIESNTTVWSAAVIAHHSTIGKHCFIAPGAMVSGRCVVEESVFLGINCTVRDHVKIAAKTIVGAGANIKFDVDKPGVYAQPQTPIYKKGVEEVVL